MSRASELKTVRVALAGCGTVGGALLDLLAQHDDELARRRNLRFEVVRILVRDVTCPRGTRVDRSCLTDCATTFAETRADVVVEALGGLDPSEQVARAALARGRGFVTANKALLRAQGPSLGALAKEHRASGAALAFEAAVAGGVPLVRLLRDSLTGHGVHRIRGVLNGTTNYILSRIEAGASYDDALRAAQRAGFAEADPTRDLSGADAADKIALLAWLAFDADPSTLEVATLGLPQDPARAVREASATDRRVRLVATAELRAGQVVATVSLDALPLSDPLALAKDEENIIQISSASSGVISLAGRGAGGPATASALLADLIHLSQPSPA